MVFIEEDLEKLIHSRDPRSESELRDVISVLKKSTIIDTIIDTGYVVVGGVWVGAFGYSAVTTISDLISNHAEPYTIWGVGALSASFILLGAALSAYGVYNGVKDTEELRRIRNELQELTKGCGV